MKQFPLSQEKKSRREHQDAAPSWETVVKRLRKGFAVLLSFSLAGCPPPSREGSGDSKKPELPIIETERKRHVDLSPVTDADKERVRTSELAVLLRRSPKILAQAGVSPQKLESLIEKEFPKIHGKLPNGDIVVTVNTDILGNGVRIQEQAPDPTALATYSYPLTDYQSDRDDAVQYAGKMLSLPIVVNTPSSSGISFQLKELDAGTLGIAYPKISFHGTRDFSRIANGQGGKIVIRPLDLPADYPKDFVRNARRIVFRKVFLHEILHHSAYFDHSEDPLSVMFPHITAEVSTRSIPYTASAVRDQIVFTGSDGVRYRIRLDNHGVAEDPALETHRLLVALSKDGAFNMSSVIEDLFQIGNRVQKN